MSENPRARPPCVMTSCQLMLGSGVVWSHAVKSGNVRGRVNPAMSCDVPLPSAPWQAAHADLKSFCPASRRVVERSPPCPNSKATGRQNQSTSKLTIPRMEGSNRRQEAFTLAPRILSGPAQDLVKLLQRLGRDSGVSYFQANNVVGCTFDSRGSIKSLKFVNNTNDAAMASLPYSRKHRLGVRMRLIVNFHQLPDRSMRIFLCSR